ncbi:MAG: MoxR family ATPase [bacterium]
MQETQGDDLKLVEELARAREKILQEISKVIIGQKEVIDELLLAMFCNGHCLIIGVPGLAKTLLVSTMSRILSLKFRRIQFTPDLMPSDITGTDVLEEDTTSRRRSFRFIKGPIFANIILADEINRTPPKTQAALLEAMQEHKVTAGGTTYSLSLPFFVLATQNPIEQEGTYPLPEAQLDRFMFNIYIDYPSEEEELNIAKLTTSAYEAELEQVLSGEDILRLQGIVRKVPVADHVAEYAIRLVRSSRPGDELSPDFVKDWVSWGAGPRASQYLLLGGKARAVMMGRYAVSKEDIKAVAGPVLRHRIITNFNAEADGIDSMEIIRRLMEIKDNTA